MHLRLKALDAVRVPTAHDAVVFGHAAHVQAGRWCQ
jgi:hypothetical protein